MLDKDGILALPIRVLDQAAKRIEFELPDGTRFYLVGGKDRRPLTGAAGFSPREMLAILRWELPTEAMRALAMVKRRFGGGITGMEGFGTNGFDPT